MIEQYGVRYLLHEDVLPENAGAFGLPDVDATFEPLQKLRAWYLANELAHGSVLWRLEQQKAFIDQLFKLRFNGISLPIWPQHPLVDYEIDGIRRSAWTLLFDQKIPINEDNIGREHLSPNMSMLTHPDFQDATSFSDALSIDRRLMNGILDHAQALGMHTSIGFQPLEFPNEFRSCLQQPTHEPVQAGGLTCAETAALNNPKHMHAIETRLRACIEQWGRADAFEIHMPEHPYAAATYLSAWRALEDRYDLSDYDLDELVARSQENYLVPGGVARSEREFKSTISMLQFFDEFFASNDLLAQMRSNDIDLTLTLGGSSEQVLPFVHRVLPDGCGMRTWVDYTSSRSVRRMRFVEAVDTSKVQATLVITLQDDNIGWVPQVATENIDILLRALQRTGWAGYYTRYWPIGDLDPPIAYLARASWDATLSPRAAYEDHFTHTFGADSTKTLCQVMRMLEDATVILDLGLSLIFPVPGTMLSHVEAETPMPEGLFHVLAIYESVRVLLTRLAKLAGSGTRNSNLNYWISRVDFGIGALHEIRLLRKGGQALHASIQAKDDRQAHAEHRQRATDFYEEALASGEAALRAAANNVRDDSDRNSIAAYYHFLVREVKQKVREVLKSPSTDQTRMSLRSPLTS